MQFYHILKEIHDPINIKNAGKHGNVKNVAGYLAAFTDQSHSGSVKIKLVSFRAVCIEAVVANLVTP